MTALPPRRQEPDWLAVVIFLAIAAAGLAVACDHVFASPIMRVGGAVVVVWAIYLLAEELCSWT